MTATLPPMLLVSVGNTRTRFAPAEGNELDPARAVPNAELPRLLDELAAELGGGASSPRVVIASVNDPVADQLESGLRGRLATLTALRLGRELPIPIEHTLESPVTVGQDRLLNALAAFSRSEQACIVVDAGTAVTVDFVDGTGVFQGGAIAPGVRMMLAAMHEQTAVLPRVEAAAALLPAAGAPPFGKTTAQAMMLGAVSAVRGGAHLLIDRYAEFYGAYPRVIATGGDAGLLFGGDEPDALVEHIVPDLTLIGMMTACQVALSADADDGER